MMRRLDSAQADFDGELERLTAWEESLDHAVNETVAKVLADVAQRGDAALVDYSARFDRLHVANAAELEISQERLQRALASIAPASKVAAVVPVSALTGQGLEALALAIPPAPVAG